MPSTKEHVMEIAVVGPGELVVRFIDRAGRTLLEEKLVVSGSPKVEGRRVIDLSVQADGERVELAPVLVRQTNPRQRVTFGGDPPARFTRKRCKEIGCQAEVASAAVRGKVAPVEQVGIGIRSSDSTLLDRALQSAVRTARAIKRSSRRNA
jgi:hypothetical protein